MGYTHVCLHQVGPQHEGFIDFFKQQILPALNEVPALRLRKAKGPALIVGPRLPERAATDEEARRAEERGSRTPSSEKHLAAS